MFRGRKAVRYPRGITHMRGREVETVIAEDTATLTEEHPRPFQLGAGHMTDWELSNLHGDGLQTTPLGEHDEPSREIQIRPVGRHRLKAIGLGKRGQTSEVIYHPRRSDTVSGVDSKTGEIIHAGARAAERKSNGRIHAQDFPARNKPDIIRDTDIAGIKGAKLQNLKRTTREHIPQPVRSIRPKRVKVDETDVPWDTRQRQPDVLHFTRYVVGSGSGSGNKSTPK